MHVWGKGTISIALPGVAAADMDLSVSDTHVQLAAGLFRLSLAARVDGATARLKRGVLTLRLRDGAG